jgi:hypothetical protein
MKAMKRGIVRNTRHRNGVVMRFPGIIYWQSMSSLLNRILILCIFVWIWHLHDDGYVNSMPVSSPASKYQHGSIYANNKNVIAVPIHWPQHALTDELDSEFNKCATQSPSHCSNNTNIMKISTLCAKLTNEYMNVLLAHRAQQKLKEYYVQLSAAGPGNDLMKLKIEHMLSVLSFAQGDVTEVSYCLLLCQDPLQYIFPDRLWPK